MKTITSLLKVLKDGGNNLAWSILEKIKREKEFG